jgi:Bacterial regulatory proteins, lacI family
MEKISLQQIYTMYRFDIRQVAERANVAPNMVARMITGQDNVSRQEVEQVLAVLSKQLGRDYTLKTVRVECKMTDG